MKHRTIRNPSAYRCWCGVIAMCLSWVAHAENPVVQTKFTADPAPLVHDGVVYLYTGHDEDDAPEGSAQFRMRDWMAYTSTDMVNWTDRGTIASLKTFPWAVQDNDAWAPQIVERNGKFYLYAPVSVEGWPKNVIGVAVADNPLGPFVDALGHPLINKAVGYIDPTVFVDDDGQAYLYWGNPNLWYVKLNADMISYSGEIVQVSSKPENYQEGPWFYKRNGHYYMAYASTCCPEGMGYAMSASPTGPWEYKGYIMKPDGRSSGNHPGIIDFRGGSYVFGFDYRLNFAITDKHHERRSISAAKFEYRSDGTIPELPWWNDAGVPQIGSLNPYVRVEAETIAWSEGIKSMPSTQGGMSVYPIRDGAYIKVRGVDFGSNGASRFNASLAYDAASKSARRGVLEVHVDAVDGPMLASLAVTPTHGKWVTKSASVKAAGGVHDVFLVFRQGAIDAKFQADYWQFERRVASR